MNEGFPKPENYIEKSPIKEGVDFVFEQHPELTEIGTKEQYSEYLDTIFPESKIKDIVYHGTNNPFDVFDKKFIGSSMDTGVAGAGFYFTRKKEAFPNQKYNLPILLNIENINNKLPITIYDLGERNSIDGRWGNDLIIDNDKISILPLDKFSQSIKTKVENKTKISLKELSELFSETFKENGFDGSEHYSNVFNGEEIVVFEPDQIHILGSKLDLDKFNEFVG